MSVVTVKTRQSTSGADYAETRKSPPRSGDFKARHVSEPIVQNLADVDFYKLTMLQFIWRFFPGTPVTFRFHNRTDVNLLEYIDIEEVRRQCARIVKMRFPKWCINELRKKYNDLFTSEFLSWLDHLRLSMPLIEERDGQLVIEATGAWEEVMLWETITMCIINRLYFLAKMKEMSLREKLALEKGAIRATHKYGRLSRYPELTFTDFGTRRRWSFKHHLGVLQIAQSMIPDQLAGTSNVYLGLKLGIKLVGTMAHELTMAFQGIYWDYDEPSAELTSQAILWEMWEDFYKGQLTIALTDTYANDFGLKDFKGYAKRWAGVRHDSGDPFEFGEKVIAFYENRGIDPKKKTLVFSDGLTDELMIRLFEQFHTRINVTFGWGTHLTNDMGFEFWDGNKRGLKPLSIVMKLVAIQMMNGEWLQTVKLSDNPAKATGPRENIERIMRKTGYRVQDHATVICEV